MAEVDASATTAGTLKPVVIRIPARLKSARVWRINHLGPADSTVRLYVGTTDPTQFRDGSASGEQDVAEYPNGLSWQSGLDLIWVWDKPGAASVHIEYG